MQFDLLLTSNLNKIARWSFTLYRAEYIVDNTARSFNGRTDSALFASLPDRLMVGQLVLVQPI